MTVELPTTLYRKNKEMKSLEVKEETELVVELSINLVVSLSNLKTLKVKGEIKEEEGIVLIDCRASHNFISEKLVSLLQLPTKDTSHYRVILGSGTTIKGREYVR